MAFPGQGSDGPGRVDLYDTASGKRLDSQDVDIYNTLELPSWSEHTVSFNKFIELKAPLYCAGTAGIAAAAEPSDKVTSPLIAPSAVVPVEVRLIALAESTPVSTKQPSVRVALEARELAERIDITTVSFPYVCSMRTTGAANAVISCTPRFRQVVAEIMFAGDTVDVVSSTSGKPTTSSFTTRGRTIRLVESEASTRSLPGAECPPPTEGRTLIKLVSANYYPGHKRAAFLCLLAPKAKQVTLIDQVDWWKGCSKTTVGSEVRILCPRRGELAPIARVWSEPGAVAFESEVPTFATGKVLTACDKPVQVLEPECFNCGNAYY